MLEIYKQPLQLSANQLTGSDEKVLYLSKYILRFQNGCNKVGFKLRFVQFWCKIILVIQIKLVLHTPLTLKSRKCVYDFRPTNTYNNAKKILSSRKATKVHIYVQVLLNILVFC